MTELISPVGRLVQGSILELQTKNKAGQPRTNKQGQPSPALFFALAFPKTQQAWWQEADPMWMAIYNAGRQGYPQHFDPQTGACKLPRFAFKVMDGDGMDDDGNPNNKKEGFAGHWIVKFGSSYVPKLVHNGQYVTDINYPKRGYFYRVAVNIVPNLGSDKPGVYINPNGVELVAYAAEITSGPNAVAMFAAVGAAQLPAGASMTPPTPTAQNGLAPGMQPVGMPAAVQQMAPPPSFTPPNMAAQMPTMPAPAMMQPAQVPVMQMQPAAIVPNHGFVQNAAQGVPHMPVMQPAQVPVMQPVYAMDPAKSQGFTREQWNAQGFADDVLLSHGIMVRTA